MKNNSKKISSYQITAILIFLLAVYFFINSGFIFFFQIFSDKNLITSLEKESLYESTTELKQTFESLNIQYTSANIKLVFLVIFIFALSIFLFLCLTAYKVWNQKKWATIISIVLASIISLVMFARSIFNGFTSFKTLFFLAFSVALLFFSLKSSKTSHKRVMANFQQKIAAMTPH